MGGTGGHEVTGSSWGRNKPELFYKQMIETDEGGAQAKIQWFSERGKSLTRDPLCGTDKQGQLKAEGAQEPQEEPCNPPGPTLTMRPPQPTCGRI